MLVSSTMQDQSSRAIYVYSRSFTASLASGRRGMLILVSGLLLQAVQLGQVDVLVSLAPHPDAHDLHGVARREDALDHSAGNRRAGPAALFVGDVRGLAEEVLGHVRQDDDLGPLGLQQDDAPR